MTIIRCPKCSYTVSDRAPACPKCKLPLRDALKPPAASAPDQSARAPEPAVARTAAPRVAPVAAPAASTAQPWWKAGSTQSLFGRINSREDALSMVRGVAIAFYGLAGLNCLAGLAVARMRGLIVDAIMWAILAWFLRAKNSRVAAVLLFVMAVGAFVVTVLNRLHITSSGGGNLILGVLVTLAAARAVEATFKLNGRFRGEEVAEAEDTPVPIIVRGRLRQVDSAPSQSG